jgi:hypothetical protein
MFRSYYMTFYYRKPSAEHEEHVHESPRNITWVLIALAFLSVAALGFGLPEMWTGREPLLESWLEPVLSVSRRWLTGAREWHDNPGLEFAFMCLSVGVATAGWFAARFLYKDARATERRLAAWKAQYATVHALVYDKYRVDELYQVTVVRGFQQAAAAMAWFDANVVDGLVNLMGTISRACAWVGGAIDKYFVDGAVNGVAWAVVEGGRRMRRIQTGRINNYVFGVVIGVVLLVIGAMVVGCSSGGAGSGPPIYVAGLDGSVVDLSSDQGALTCGCTGGQGCMRATVTRTASDAMLPWVQFVGQGSDGIGTLVVAATEMGSVAAASRKTTANADFTQPSAVYPVDLGCLPAATYTVSVFLDDNLNATATDATSSDFHDACMLNRSPQYVVNAGQLTLVQPLTLSNSCD